MNTDAEVRSRRLTAFLEEALAGGAPPDLAERIVVRVRAVPPRPRPATFLTAALVLLAGVLVTGAVALLQNGTDDAKSLQDPHARVAVVTTASLRDAIAPIEPLPTGDAIERILTIAEAAGATVVVKGDVAGTSKADLRGATWREAIERIAAERGTGVGEFGTALVVGVGPVVPPERSRVTVQTEEIGTLDLLKLLHSRCGANFVIAPDVGGRVRLDVANVPWRAVLDSVAAQLGLQVEARGGVFAVHRHPSARERGKSVANSREPVVTIRDALGAWAHLSNATVFVAPTVRGSVALVKGSRTSSDDLLLALAATANFDARTEDGIVHVGPSLAPNVGIALTNEGMVLPELVQLSWFTFEPNVQIADSLDTKVAVLVSGSAWFDVLRAASVASGRTFLRTKHGYRIE